MPSFGAWLMQNRLLRELSVDEVSRLTRVAPQVIVALEQDQVLTLHDPAKALQVARTVALAVGLDPEDAALRLQEWMGAQTPPGPRTLRERVAGALPREPLVWAVLAATAAACTALLLRR